jgi:hypothetical protein
MTEGVAAAAMVCDAEIAPPFTIVRFLLHAADLLSEISREHSASCAFEERKLPLAAPTPRRNVNPGRFGEK